MNFTRYVGIDMTDFWNIANQWVNRDIFIIKDGTRPIRKFTVGVDYEG